MTRINQLAKLAAEKQAFAGLVGAGIGGAVGAANLPSDATSADRARYASQGALRGGGLGTGASVGAGLGYLGSQALMKNQKDPSTLRTTIATLLPFLTGAAGGTLGYDIGDQFARNPGFALDDKSSAGDEAKADKREERKEEEKQGGAIGGVLGGLGGVALANHRANQLEKLDWPMKSWERPAAMGVGGSMLGLAGSEIEDLIRSLIPESKKEEEKKAGMIGGLLGGGAMLMPVLTELENIQAVGGKLNPYGVGAATGVTALAGSQIEELIRKAYRRNSKRREEEEKQGFDYASTAEAWKEKIEAMDDAIVKKQQKQLKADKLSRGKSYAATGGGALVGGTLANLLHKKFREDEGSDLERGLTTAVGGLGGGALGYGLSKLLQKKATMKKTTKEAALKSLVLEKIAKSPAWQRKAGKNSEGGLNAKGRASYNKSTGGNLKAPVTSKKPKGKAKKRKASFCARMSGMKKKNTSKSTANDPDSRINKSLRKWNC